MTNQNLKISFHDMLTERDPLIGPPIVINADKDKKRWADICEHFSKWNIIPQRFPAVNGVKLPALPPSMCESASAPSISLTHAAVSRYCSLFTQKKAWLVLEDDCRFVEDPRKVIISALNCCAESNFDWSIISLGSFSYDKQGKRPPISYDAHNFTLCKPTAGWFPWGSHSYLVNRSSGLHISAQMSLCLYPSDHVLISEINSGKGLLRRPAATYQEEYPSYRGGTADTKSSADLHPDIINEIMKIKVSSE